MNEQPDDTLYTRLATLPAQTTIDFRAIQSGGRDIWYAYWRVGNAPYACRLGPDEHGQIARGIARRKASSERITSPSEPVARKPKRTYSAPRSGDYRRCQHQYGKVSLACETCRDWNARHAPKRVTAMVWG